MKEDSNKAKGLASKKTSTEIKSMFDSIAVHYDFLNAFLTFGIDSLWRRYVARNLAHALNSHPKPYLLDIATGTGKLAQAISRNIPHASIVGIDISSNMLAVAKRNNNPSLKSTRKPITFHLADATAMPFEDNTFHASSCGFGTRNFENLDKGLSEIYRVLCPGGRVAILEPMIPNHILKDIYLVYFNKVLPLLGRWISKSSFAYTYFSRSVSSYPQEELFLEHLRKTGFKNLRYTPLTFQTAILYTACK